MYLQWSICKAQVSFLAYDYLWDWSLCIYGIRDNIWGFSCCDFPFGMCLSLWVAVVAEDSCLSSVSLSVIGSSLNSPWDWTVCTMWMDQWGMQDVFECSSPGDGFILGNLVNGFFSPQINEVSSEIILIWLLLYKEQLKNTFTWRACILMQMYCNKHSNHTSFASFPTQQKQTYRV